MFPLYDNTLSSFIQHRSTAEDSFAAGCAPRLSDVGKGNCGFVVSRSFPFPNSVWERSYAGPPFDRKPKTPEKPQAFSRPSSFRYSFLILRSSLFARGSWLFR